MIRPAVLLASATLLAACGATQPLKPAPGTSLPVAPYGAIATPTPDDLVTSSTQARPARTEELLTNSRPRTSDDFDLPPDR